jgi:2-succinyl-5-enolpyruvyl-6-hydroxy-3-cyclohexene-1-carboxylate synthase
MDNHPGLTTYVIHDERSAGFYALGLSIEFGEPVGLVCTSGSAVVNYYPAIAEAYYQCVPLVVISADRPEEWVNHGDGQTIVQKGVFDNHIHGFYSVPEEGTPQLKTAVNEIFNNALLGWKGPVHFNCPLSEPLYETTAVEDPEANDKQPLAEETKLSINEIASINSTWRAKKKKLILCGQMDKNPRLNDLLEQLASDPSVVVLVENTSNLYSNSFNHCIDRSLQGIGTSDSAFQPDLLITLGGAIISKRIKAYLRSIGSLEHWRIGEEFPEMDTYRAMIRSYKVSPEHFIGSLLEIERGVLDSNYAGRWRTVDYTAKDKAAEFVSTAAYSDLTVFDTVLDLLPEDSYLHMSNSSVVRYCQLFDPVKSIKYFCNRGTSGIDGSTSTAAGVSIASPDKLNVFITGDVSFFYDSNALWNNYLGSNFRVILINNGGGGIFRIIEGPSGAEQLEKYFEAKHDHSAEYLCKAFNVQYSKAESIEELGGVLPEFYDTSDTPRLLEVFTPSEVNPDVLESFFKELN